MSSKSIFAVYFDPVKENSLKRILGTIKEGCQIYKKVQIFTYHTRMTALRKLTRWRNWLNWRGWDCKQGVQDSTVWVVRHKQIKDDFDTENTGGSLEAKKDLGWIQK